MHIRGETSGDTSHCFEIEAMHRSESRNYITVGNVNIKIRTQCNVSSVNRFKGKVRECGNVVSERLKACTLSKNFQAFTVLR